MNEQTLSAMKSAFVGREINYCFHLHTPIENRRRFTITGVEPDGDGWFKLIGEERMIQSSGVHTHGYIRDRDSWIKEGSVYMWMGEEPRIDDKVWGEWFGTAPRVRMPRGI